MKLAFILLTAVAPLALGGCPAILEGVNTTHIAERVEGLAEVIDTVCGRRNFTSRFWSEHFRELLIVQITGQTLIDNLTGVDAPERPFRPLLLAIHNELEAMNNTEAKAYVEAFSKNQRDFTTGLVSSFASPQSPESSGESPFHPVLGMFQRMFQMIGNLFSIKTSHRLSVEAQVALAQTLKKGFAYEETMEMKIERIQTAMKALERIDIDHDHDRVALLFAQMYLLAKEKSVATTFTKEKTSFEEFAQWMAEEWVVAGTPILDILPAVETLFLEYRTLDNTQAKAFAHSVLSTQIFMTTHMPYNEDGQDMPEVLKVVGEALGEDHARDVYRVCPPRNSLKCYNNLPEDVKAALTSTFPELAAYLSTTDWFEKWRAKLSEREIDESIYVKKNATKPFRRFIAIIPKNTS